MNISIIIAQAEHFKYAQEIYTIELSALLRKEWCKKELQNTSKKDGKQRCSYCIRQWQASWFLLHRKLAGEQLCRHSGLIVHPDYRNLGLAKKIKAKVLTIL
jgi:ribosomal protein S18 acetylase RimI-like enzyme